LRLITEREELKIVDDQVGAPTCALDLALAATEILAGLLEKAKSGFRFADASGTYHMTAGGQTTWYEFAKAILDEASHAQRNLPWLSSAMNDRPIIARRVLPISTEEFGSPTTRPAYSVLSNALLMQTLGVALPDWRTQLQRCFA
jgi:dTDP-4-dehydrorhamnose reductase